MQVKSYEAERACGLTFQFSERHVDACETRAAREGIKRPCGPEQSKYRQRCQGVQVSDGLGGQRFKFAIARVPVIFIGFVQSLLLQLSTLRFLQFASTSSVPAGRKRGSIGRGVRGFKLVMVSAIMCNCSRFRNRRPTTYP